MNSIKKPVKNNKNEFFGPTDTQTSNKGDNSYGLSQLIKTNVKFNGNDSFSGQFNEDENYPVDKKLSTSGTIGAAIGSAIGNNRVTSPINSPTIAHYKKNESELR